MKNQNYGLTEQHRVKYYSGPPLYSRDPSNLNDYLEKRKRNNLSVRKSRLRRAQKDKLNQEKIELLEKIISELKVENHKLVLSNIHFYNYNLFLRNVIEFEQWKVRQLMMKK